MIPSVCFKHTKVRGDAIIAKQLIIYSFIFPRKVGYEEELPVIPCRTRDQY